MSQVRYNQGGYAGCSRSNRAVEAEADGKLPLSRAIREVASIADVTQRRAREALTAVGPCEWHHTSKHANRTDYYSVSAACGWLAAQPLLAKLPADLDDQMHAAILRGGDSMDARHAEILAVATRVGEAAGIDPETVKNLYYELWDEIE